MVNSSNNRPFAKVASTLLMMYKGTARGRGVERPPLQATNKVLSQISKDVDTKQF